ncbi:class I SAM-dependent methyltransferase [Haladaptatus salinisoli]|uniref:class I SAM-dependent methyltransferase n=1 Tax=Haladaptatus salinisoli TaxID=2884876 RepID=UPI001D0B6E68|nr:class I SAM-dependent methyltransferase [Haladaptatus salinisoli]
MDDLERKRLTTASFGELAGDYLDSDVHRTGADLELLASWCDDATRALDVACGAGHTAAALADAGVPTVVAADATPAMVATAAEAFDVVGTVADAERLPFADDAFDAVTCRIAAHHFPAPRAFLREVVRVLAPGGVFAFEDNVAPDDERLAAFFDRFERLRDPSHGEAVSVERWLDRFREAGFAIDESTTVRKELDYEAWVDRTNPDEERREELRELVRRPEAKAVYGVTVEDGAVRGFGNEKVLIRATK